MIEGCSDAEEGADGRFTGGVEHDSLHVLAYVLRHSVQFGQVARGNCDLRAQCGKCPCGGGTETRAAADDEYVGMSQVFYGFVLEGCSASVSIDDFNGQVWRQGYPELGIDVVAKRTELVIDAVRVQTTEQRRPFIQAGDSQGDMIDAWRGSDCLQGDGGLGRWITGRPSL